MKRFNVNGSQIADAASQEDPAPQPPARPDIDDCCRSGCVPCVFDLYEEAMERYRIELAAWEARRASGRSHVARSFTPAKNNDKI